MLEKKDAHTRTHIWKQDKHAEDWAAATRGSCSHRTQKKHKSTWNNVPLLFSWHPKSWGEIYADTYTDATARARLQPAVASHKTFCKKAFLWFNQKKKVKEVGLKMKLVIRTEIHRPRSLQNPINCNKASKGTKAVFHRQHLKHTSKCHYHSSTYKPQRML